MNNLKSESHFEKIKYILLSILITSNILLIIFITMGYYPFGERSVLRIDLYHQYAPFHEELRAKILSGDSFFYSWESGLGKDFFAQMAYYTFSPLSFLIILFPSNLLPEAMLIFIALKIIACSGIFAYYLKRKFKVNDLSIVIFSIMYAFMAHISAFFWNVMWLDVIVLFPIIILGIDALVKEGKYKTYIISLALSILVNFYITFLVCIFATLYFLITVFSKYSIKKDLKIIFNRMLKFGIFSLISGGLVMFLVIPTVLAILKTSTSETTFPKFEIYSNIFQILTSFFLGATPSVLSGNNSIPNAYTGILTIILLPTYFANKKIKLKEKLLYTCFIFFIILCTIIKPLDFIIHGGHFPAGLPHRYTFISSFILLTLGFKSFNKIKDLSLPTLYVSSLIMLTLSFISRFVVSIIPESYDVSNVLSINHLITNVILVIIYNIILTFYKKVSLKYENQKVKKVLFYILPYISFILLVSCVIGGFIYSKNSKFEFAFKLFFGEFNSIFLIIFIFSLSVCLLFFYCSLKNKKMYSKNFILAILLIVISGESLFSAVKGFTFNGSTVRESYLKYLDDMEDLLAYIEETDTDENKFFRQEFRRFTAINENAFYHYNGFSTFSSTAYGNTTELIKLLGIAATGNSYRYYDPTPLLNAIFNIKYIMNKEGAMTDPTLEYVETFNTVTLYKNPYYLSLGFMVNEDFKEWEASTISPFIAQNELLKSMTNINDDFLTPVEIADFNFQHITVTENEEIETKYSYSLINKNDTVNVPTVTAKIVNPKTQRLFIYIDSSNSSRFYYTISGLENDRELSTHRSLIDLGIVEEGEVIDIEFRLDRTATGKTKYAESGDFKVFASGVEEDVFENGYNQLEDELLIVTNYSSDEIEGTINVLEDGILFTSIPYDTGWEAYVDGEKVETLSVANDGLLALNLLKGEHTIHLKYKTNGLKLGIILSLLSLIAFIGCIYFEIYTKKKKS